MNTFTIKDAKMFQKSDSFQLEMSCLEAVGRCTRDKYCIDDVRCPLKAEDDTSYIAGECIKSLRRRGFKVEREIVPENNIVVKNTWRK